MRNKKISADVSQEAIDDIVGFSRTTADGKWWFCPSCNGEISQVEVDEQE